MITTTRARELAELVCLDADPPGRRVLSILSLSRLKKPATPPRGGALYARCLEVIYALAVDARRLLLNSPVGVSGGV